MENKLDYKQWVDKYFEKLTHDTWTSIYEKVEAGFAPSDLSHYMVKDLKERYKKYLDGTEDFLEYEEQ